MVENVKEQVTDFIVKCEELKNCKFIMATAKIKDLLKSIVNSGELYELFSTVTANFNYPAEKQKCFIEGERCRVILPGTVGDRLAFIFCLLVEFDRNDINFNAFLQKYYPKDGSFYSSYHLFCDEVIQSLENIVCDIYSKELNSAPEQTALPAPAADNSAALILIESEREAVKASPLSDDDKDAGDAILCSLEEAVKSGDGAHIKSLACGYNYFVLYTGLNSGIAGDLFESLSLLLE